MGSCSIDIGFATLQDFLAAARHLSIDRKQNRLLLLKPTGHRRGPKPPWDHQGTDIPLTAVYSLNRTTLFTCSYPARLAPEENGYKDSVSAAAPRNSSVRQKRGKKDRDAMKSCSTINWQTIEQERMKPKQSRLRITQVRSCLGVLARVARSLQLNARARLTAIVAHDDARCEGR